MKGDIKINDSFLFRELLSTTTDSIYFKDRDSKIIYCSKHLAGKHNAKSADELIGKTDFDLFTEEHARQAYEDEQHIMKTGTPIIGKLEKETYSDGSIRWSSTSKYPLFNSEKEIIGTFGISRDVTAQIKAEEELKASKEKIQKAWQENQLLLAEMHHRVKNNLAVILGIIDLQIYKLMDSDQPVPEILLSTKTRIKSIANVHELLYRTDNFAEVDIRDLLLKLSDDLKSMFNRTDHIVDINLDVERITMNTTQAVPFCLLMHELIQNSYKHAFTNAKKGEISLKVEKSGPSTVIIYYSDNGKGMDKDFIEIMQQSDSLGLMLISALVEQLDATYQSTPSSEGFNFTFEFTISEENSGNPIR